MSAEASTGARKKTKGRYVSSRYKQAAESYIGRSPEETLMVTNKTQVKKPTKDSGGLNSTEMNVTSVLGKKTSTPTKESATLPTFDPYESCVFAEPQLLKDKRKMNALSSVVKKIPPKKAPTFQQPAKQINQEERNMDAEIDILYAEYQLALLFENKAKKSLREKTQTAMEKIDKALCYLKTLLIEHIEVQKELNHVTFLLKLHEHLRKQGQAYEPLMNSLPTMEKQYEEIAVAVDKVRHKLFVQDVQIPEPGSEREIIQLVEKVCLQMGQILGSVPNLEDITTTAEAASAFASQAKIITEEIKRGSALLAESRGVLLSDTALTIASLTLDEQEEI